MIGEAMAAAQPNMFEQPRTIHVRNDSLAYDTQRFSNPDDAQVCSMKPSSCCLAYPVSTHIQHSRRC